MVDQLLHPSSDSEPPAPVISSAVARRAEQSHRSRLTDEQAARDSGYSAHAASSDNSLAETQGAADDENESSSPSFGEPNSASFGEPNSASFGEPNSATPSKYDMARRRIGVVLDDKWRLDRLLGVGGMAAVYAATHRNGARAAIKLLPFTLATGPEVCQRLLREGYLANRIQHPAVTRVLDDHIDYDKEHAYIVMELLEGETARQRVDRQGPLEPKQAVALMLELADCLSSAHAANVVHRDIKPENLFLTDEGLKVLDFGIARALDGNSSLTQTGTSLGTPAYMAPEQARGKQNEISPRSDLYSVGATLLFLLTGKNLHEGENALELMVRAAWTPAPPAQEITPSLPDNLAAIIDRCCAFEPAERIQSAEELIYALSALRSLSERVLVETSSSLARALPALDSQSATIEAASPSKPPSLPPMRSRRWAPLVALAVLLLAALGFGLFGSWGASTSAEPSAQEAPGAAVASTAQAAQGAGSDSPPSPRAVDEPAADHPAPIEPSTPAVSAASSSPPPLVTIVPSAAAQPAHPVPRTPPKPDPKTKPPKRSNAVPKTTSWREPKPATDSTAPPKIDYNRFRGKH